jgi:hypothetical protein
MLDGEVETEREKFETAILDVLAAESRSGAPVR